MREFSKPSRKPMDEPPGLDAFTLRAPGTILNLVNAPAAPGSSEPLTMPAREPFVAGMNIQFTAREKAALVKVATAESRSQHAIVKRLLGPALIELARQLDEGS